MPSVGSIESQIGNLERSPFSERGCQKDLSLMENFYYYLILRIHYSSALLEYSHARLREHGHGRAAGETMQPNKGNWDR